jgi:hypothetical protein
MPLPQSFHRRHSIPASLSLGLISSSRALADGQRGRTAGQPLSARSGGVGHQLLMASLNSLGVGFSPYHPRFANYL